MKLSIQIDSENESCTTREELCRMVQTILPRIRTAEPGTKCKILDVNGNTVGSYVVSGDEEEDYDPEDPT